MITPFEEIFLGEQTGEGLLGVGEREKKFSYPLSRTIPRPCSFYSGVSLSLRATPASPAFSLHGTWSTATWGEEFSSSSSLSLQTAAH